MNAIKNKVWSSSFDKSIKVVYDTESYYFLFLIIIIIYYLREKKTKKVNIQNKTKIKNYYFLHYIMFTQVN